MNPTICHSLRVRTLLTGVLAGAAMLPIVVSAQPSSRPLLSSQSGAKPNLMIALDNSGSMAFPYHENYAIQFADNNNNALLVCAGARTFARQTANGDVLNGRVDPLRPAGQRCFQTNSPPNADGSPNFATGSAWVGNGVAYVPALTARNNWNAMRSADLNPVYYNPRTTYSPRLGPDYVALPRPANINFVSNGNNHRTTASFYSVWRNGADGALYTTNTQKPAPAAPAWLGAAPNVYNLSVMWAFPTHLEYNATSGATPSFVYAYCRDAAGNSTVQRDAQGMEYGCTSVRNPPFATTLAGSVTTVFAPGHPSAAGNIIQLPPDHQRTDCGGGATTCTNEQERINILNWYHWYSTRQLATSTAIGQSLASNAYQNKLNIGYLPINDYTLPNGALGGNTNLAIVRNPAVDAPGTATGDANVLRGVRNLEGGSTANTELFGFLNNMQSRGGTPLHNAIEKVAEYYNFAPAPVTGTPPAGAVENPWARNPGATVSAGNPLLECRRSFNLLFSDGAWTGQPTAPAAGNDYVNSTGLSVTHATGGSPVQYSPTGSTTLAGRLLYTPYAGTVGSSGGLADLTAKYYWHTDLPNAVFPNNVSASPELFPFSQNMTTYTVGYQIKPSGEVQPTGLTFDQIDNYTANFVALGYAASTKPTWPTGNLLSGTSQQRVDDFIQAGYTGGGRSFSARTADDVRSIFDFILSTILNQSGRDAGVAVDSGGGDNSTLTGRVKYTVSYRTQDNTGSILARELDADGDETGVTLWTAENQMPTPANRRIFTMHDTDQPVDFLGRVDAFPSDIRDALRNDNGPGASRVADDDTFVRYLRGVPGLLDAEGDRFRPLRSKYAAMVNPPSVLMGGKRDFAYDLLQDEFGVDGRSSYGDFAARKRGYPESLFVATNAGVMHALSARAGDELAAVMPRRSLKRMLDFSKEPYNFEYVLDGPISEHDVFDRRIVNRDSLPESEQWRAWRHLGIGAGGRGEQLIYAVNSPIKPGSPPAPGDTDLRRQPDRADYLWETGPDIINTADGGDVTLGYIANPSRSGQTEDAGNNGQRGRWIVAVNNGHYNGQTDGSEAGLVILNSLTGEVIRTIPLPSGYSAGRGLSGVTLIRDYEVSTRVIGAYAGDANGNLWRFDLKGDPSTWAVSHGAPLFTVPGNRPVFGHPAWQDHPGGGRIVVFATGMLLEESDLNDLGEQTIFAIWDRKNIDGTMVDNEPFTATTFAQLQEQTVRSDDAVTNLGRTYFHISDNPIDWSTQRGWYMRMQFAEGERSIANVINFGTSAIITSTVIRPASSEEMCTVSDLPGNYVYVLHALTGAQSRSFSFDVNNDDRLDNYAVAFIPTGGFSRGISVQRFYAERDGTPVTSDPWPAPDNLSDPAIVLPDSVRLANKADEDSGESYIPRNCQGQRGTVIGIGEEALGIGVQCPLTGWNRTQFQLSAPPSN
jgi:type IV pilus assembly protein PilY1